MPPSYSIDQTQCTFCGGCSSVCPAQAIIIRDGAGRIAENCIRCGNCFRFCPISAVTVTQENIDP